MPDKKLYIIENRMWQVGILPETGASIAFGRINHNGEWHDLLRPTPEADYSKSAFCASYVLFPWSNRIRDGKFRFNGQDYQLHINADDGTAIHGVGKDYPWKVETANESGIVLSFCSGEHQNINFPFRFSARVNYQVHENKLTVTSWLKNEDTVPFPAGFGHHPYFMRTLVGPNDEVKLQIPCPEYFVLENAMPAQPPISVDPRADFQHMRLLGNQFIDDCLTGRQNDDPVRFKFEQSGVSLAMHFDRIFKHIVVYVPLQKPFFAVEPVTNVNDGFNLYDMGITETGVFVLQPSEERQGTFALELE